MEQERLKPLNSIGMSPHPAQVRITHPISLLVAGSTHLTKIMPYVGKVAPGTKAAKATTDIVISLSKPGTLKTLVSLIYLEAGVDEKEGFSLETFQVGLPFVIVGLIT